MRWLARLFCRHSWIRLGGEAGPHFCESCGALRGAHFTYADFEELLIALRSLENFMGSDAEAKLICHLGARDAMAA